MVVLLCVRATSGDGFTTATNVTYPIRHFPPKSAHVILEAPVFQRSNTGKARQFLLEGENE
jgi:hypothetical protein